MKNKEFTHSMKCGSHDIGYVQNRWFWIAQMGIQPYGTCRGNIHGNSVQNSWVRSRLDFKSVRLLSQQVAKLTFSKERNQLQ